MTEESLSPLPEKSLSDRKNHVVKIRDVLMYLCADATNEHVTKWWHSAKKDRRADFQSSIRLRKLGENDVAFIHGFKSAKVYSGS